ncbi:DUF7007 domain-containing protein [Changpingibacter yushuensis]|uniref:DUF7007 domain-containing protein n=1 Tax=Changpingibacter yushuensis TaxID=2758440 RepID=UPI0015F72B4F|nr:hypothetical protein [Changpingibacter yushuensis]
MSMSASAKERQEQYRKPTGEYGNQPGVNAPGGVSLAPDTLTRDEFARTHSIPGPDEDWTQEALTGGFSKQGWGQLNHATPIATGITICDGESHGGIKLSPERNAHIPKSLRTSSGWYEEDCEFHIVSMCYPEEFSRSTAWTNNRSADEWFEDSSDSVRGWFPNQWEEATGRTIAPGESRLRDEQVFMEETKDAFHLRTCKSDAENPGCLIASLRRPSDDKGVLARVSEEADHRCSHLKAYDETSLDVLSEAVTPVLAEKRIYKGASPDFSHLSPSRRHAAGEALGKLYRYPEGVMSRAEHIATLPVTGREHIGRGYYIAYDQKNDNGTTTTHVTKLPKEAWEAYGHIPERTDVVDDERIAQRGWSVAGFDKAHAAYVASARENGYLTQNGQVSRDAPQEAKDVFEDLRVFGARNWLNS